MFEQVALIVLAAFLFFVHCYLAAAYVRSPHQRLYVMSASKAIVTCSPRFIWLTGATMVPLSSDHLQVAIASSFRSQSRSAVLLVL